MAAVVDCFSADYAEARGKFRRAAAAAGATLASHRSPAPGPGGLALTTDVALLGPAEAERALVVLSGTHGGEGFAGSGIQVGWLREGRWRHLPDGVAVLLVHALNPFGFSWLRRVNEDNVDLNRNFLDHAAGHPENPQYRALRPALAPEGRSFAAVRAADAAIEAYVAAHGEKALLAACSGQYDDPEGVFYGGRAEAWSNRTLRQCLGAALPRARLVAHVDLHTGLGPYGVGEAISYHAPAAPEHAKALAWYAENVTTPRGGSASVPVNRGKTGDGAIAALPRAEVVCITLEFGTWSQPEVIAALRAEHWLWRQGKPDGPEARHIKAQFRRAFYPDEDDWKRMVWARGDQVLRGATEGLGAA